jgi:hypothetical protein
MRQILVTYDGDSRQGLVLTETAEHKLIYFNDGDLGLPAVLGKIKERNTKSVLSYIEGDDIYEEIIIGSDCFIEAKNYFPQEVAEKLALYATFQNVTRGAEMNLQQSLFIDYNFELPQQERSKFLYNQEVVFLKTLFG